MRIAAVVTMGMAAAVATFIAFRLCQPYAFAGPGILILLSPRIFSRARPPSGTL